MMASTVLFLLLGLLLRCRQAARGADLVGPATADDVACGALLLLLVVALFALLRDEDASSRDREPLAGSPRESVGPAEPAKGAPFTEADADRDVYAHLRD